MQISCFKVIVLICLLSGAAWAGGLDIGRIGMGARTIAMGRAQAAARDLPSIFVNPANAATIDKFGAISMYTSPAEDLNYGLLAIDVPIKDGNMGTFGIAYLSSAITGMQSTSLDAAGRAYPISSFDFSSKLMTLSYGKEVSPNLFSGVSLKFFSKNFEGVQGGSASGADIDLGLIFFPNDNLVLALSAQNILPSDWGNLSWGTGFKEDLPINLKMGGSYATKEEFQILADYDSLGAVHIGGEYWLKKNLALRCGAEAYLNGINFSLGVGVKHAGFSFDYAYYFDTNIFSNSTHYFSLGYELPYRSIELRPFMPAQGNEEAAFLD